MLEVYDSNLTIHQTLFFESLKPLIIIFTLLFQPLLEACEHLIRSHARRIPLIDTDATTGKDAILCVLTQYRVLKFIAINVNPLHSSSPDL